jgi:branched-subunit amino acid ABC-type transport system permease component
MSLAAAIERPKASQPMGHRVRRVIKLLLIVASLQACASVDLQRRDETTCADRGIEPGTSDFAACVQEQQTLRAYFLTMPHR